MRYFVVDSFTDALFHGNPAGVCLPEAPLCDKLMQQIAAENNLAETAFVLPRAGGGYDLRWFTPAAEIDLCGHATLASAFVLRRFVEPGAARFVFHTKSGPLIVTYADSLYEMDFPARPAQPVEVTQAMRTALGCGALEACLARDLLLVLPDEAAVRTLAPNFEALRSLPGMGVIVTAPGESVDFVSRFFAVKMGIPEDPVTGSSHCTLIPFWASRLGKPALAARQLSPRGGALFCRDNGARVTIAGRAVLYLSGSLHCVPNS